MDRNNSNDRTTAGVIAAIAIIATIALLALAGLGGVSCAAEGENAGGSEGEIAGAAVSAASVTDSINYQGRLTGSSGSPLAGTYTMTFGLYDVSTGGTALDTDTHQVNVTDGLFNTYLDFDQSYFDGRELWLGATVGTDGEMTPRQELRSVPYAMGLVPGARIDGSVSGHVLEVKNNRGYQGAGVRVSTTGISSYGVSASTTGNYSFGVYAQTSGDDSYGVYAQTSGDDSYGVSAHSTKSYGVYGSSMSVDGAGVYAQGRDSGADLILGGNANTGVGDDGKIYSDPAYASSDIYLITNDGLRIDLDNDGDGEDADFEIRDINDTLIFNVDESSGVYSHATATTGSNNHGVRAYSDYGYGVYGKGKYGGYFTTNQAGTEYYDRTAGVNATTTHDYSDGVRASTIGDDSYGVWASTIGDDSYGVWADTTGDNSDGVCARTNGRNSNGVWAYTTGDLSNGVHAHTTGNYSDGVHAYSSKGYGVYGKGKYGGYFTTNQDGMWFDHTAGVDVSTTRDYSDGVRASTTGYSSYGVQVFTTGHSSDGVHVYTTGDHSKGLYVCTSGDNSTGLYVCTPGDNSTGVRAYSINDYGVYGRSDSTDRAGVYAQGKDGGADLILGGNAETDAGDNGNIHSDPRYPSSDIVLVTNDCIRIDLDNDGNGEDADFEIYDKDDNRIFDVDESGNVYAKGTFQSNSIDVAEYFPTPEDPAPGTVMVIDPAGGSKLRSSTKAYDTTVAGIVSTAPGVSLGTREDGNDGEKLIAVAGRVPCKVDASYAAIKPGDLLTTSDTPGHAMKATSPVIGTILGKALAPLDAGTGTIEVLVTLQ